MITSHNFLADMTNVNRIIMLPLNLAFALWFFSFGTTKVWAEEALTLETAKAAAANGDVKAEYFLARQYAKGTGVLQD